MYENDMKIIERAQNGSKEDMTKLIEDNSRLVWSIVRRFNGRGYDIEDLYQIGSIGLIKAIQRFDTSFEVRLSTYAVPYILGEIKRFIRDDGPIKISRSIKELNIKIIELQKEYLNKYGKEITLEQLAKELKTSKEDIAMALDSARPVNSIEDSQYRDNKTDKTISLIDQLSSGKDEENEITNRITIKKLISELKDNEKEVILLRYYKGKTQMQVAKILGILMFSDYIAIDVNEITGNRSIACFARYKSCIVIIRNKAYFHTVRLLGNCNTNLRCNFTNLILSIITNRKKCM